MSRIVAIIASCLFSSIAHAATADHWTIVTQERRVYARVTAGFGADDTTESAEFFGDYGLFDKSARASVAMVSSLGFGEVDSSSSAGQHSQLTSRRILVDLAASGASVVFGDNVFSDTVSWSRMSVEFDLDTNGAIRLDGPVECGSAACFFQLFGPDGFASIDLFIPGASHAFDGDQDVYAAPPGRYSLYADMYTNTVTIDEGAFESGSIDVEVALVTCGAPINPVECVIADGNRGDTDADGDVDVDDVPGFTACLTGPMGGINSGACIPADVDEDGDVDLADFYAMLLL